MQVFAIAMYLHAYDGKFNILYVLSYSTKKKLKFGSKKQKRKISIKTQSVKQPVTSNTHQRQKIKTYPNVCTSIENYVSGNKKKEIQGYS